MSQRILLVEDEEKIARMVELELSHEGYRVVKAFDGLSGLDKAEGEQFDLVLLDIMLPKLSGMEVLRRIRKNSSVPVIMLTARDAVMDKVSGLDSGADDYITKPFEIEELLARIRACLRKSDVESSSESGNLLCSGDLIMDVEAHEVRWNSEQIDLTLREFDLLKCLLENKGRVLSRDLLLDKVWGYDYIGETNAVDVYIRFLRSKIDEKYETKVITTVRGLGYQIKNEKE